jgi:hypothetical protein
MARKRSRSGRRKRRRPDLLDELTVTGLSRATESRIEDLCFEALKDPDYQEEMLKRSERFFALLSAGFKKKLKALRKARAASRGSAR